MYDDHIHCHRCVGDNIGPPLKKTAFAPPVAESQSVVTESYPVSIPPRDFRTEQRVAADDHCSLAHFSKRYGGAGSQEIAVFLGLPDRDTMWVTPWFKNVTHLCARTNGGLDGRMWTVRGWVLDDSSMASLKQEFPDHSSLVPGSD